MVFEALRSRADSFLITGLPLEGGSPHEAASAAASYKSSFFPDGELISTFTSTLTIAAKDAGFEVRDVENLREHYVRQRMRAWVRNLDRNRSRRRAASDAKVSKPHQAWRLDIAGKRPRLPGGTARGCFNRFLHGRRDGGVGLPPTRNDLYQHAQR